MPNFLFQFDIDDERIFQAVHTGTTRYTKVWKHFYYHCQQVKYKDSLFDF